MMKSAISRRIRAVSMACSGAVVSMIKVPIMIGMFAAIDRWGLDFDQSMTCTDSLLYPGEDMPGSLGDAAVIHLSPLMLSTSDKTDSGNSSHECIYS